MLTSLSKKVEHGLIIVTSSCAYSFRDLSTNFVWCLGTIIQDYSQPPRFACYSLGGAKRERLGQTCKFRRTHCWEAFFLFFHGLRFVSLLMPFQLFPLINRRLCLRSPTIWNVTLGKSLIFVFSRGERRLVTQKRYLGPLKNGLLVYFFVGLLFFFFGEWMCFVAAACVTSLLLKLLAVPFANFW